jgi:hypothetical protein
MVDHAVVLAAHHLHLHHAVVLAAHPLLRQPHVNTAVIRRNVLMVVAEALSIAIIVLAAKA